MAALLQSYMGGQWIASDDEGISLHSAITGDEISRTLWMFPACWITDGMSAAPHCGS